MNSTKNNTAKKILVVDDESEMRLALEATLEREGFTTVSAKEGEEGLRRFQEGGFDLVISDVKMPKMSGVELLRAIKRQSPGTEVIMMTAYGDIDNAVETMKEGAFDYLLKPFSADILVCAVNRAFLLREPAAAPRRPAQAPGPAPSILTQSPKMRELMAYVDNIAYSKSTVLLMGETGTGKELFARYIHQQSPRAGKPFMPINCAALPEGLLETEMFGHEKGAFTGAAQTKEGKFQLAHQGTLLLDEVTEMPLTLQAKLLRVLQEHEIDRVGGREPIPVDVRVIATTNRDIRKRVRENLFREDLYYRLNVIPVKLMPLRERMEDLPLLARHFMEVNCRANGRAVPRLAEETLSLLQKYHWPGNIRELANIIERAVLLCPGDTLLPAHLFFDEDVGATDQPGAPSPQIFTGTLQEMEKALILKTLEEAGGNRTRAAQCLGISIRTLRNKLNEYKNLSSY